jgi:hypothetical protein
VVSFTPRSLYLQEIALDINWIGDYVGPEACLEAVENRKDLLSLPGIEP